MVNVREIFGCSSKNVLGLVISIFAFAVILLLDYFICSIAGNSEINIMFSINLYLYFARVFLYAFFLGAILMLIKSVLKEHKINVSGLFIAALIIIIVSGIVEIIRTYLSVNIIYGTDEAYEFLHSFADFWGEGMYPEDFKYEEDFLKKLNILSSFCLISSRVFLVVMSVVVIIKVSGKLRYVMLFLLAHFVHSVIYLIYQMFLTDKLFGIFGGWNIYTSEAIYDYFLDLNNISYLSYMITFILFVFICINACKLLPEIKKTIIVKLWVACGVVILTFSVAPYVIFVCG